MESTARLYHCMRCHRQVIICRKCDRGNLYCGSICAGLARKKSLQLAGARYQSTFNGKRHNAARQARFRMKHKNIVTHHTSRSKLSCAPMQLLENKTEKIEKIQQNMALNCHFCREPVSVWIRNDFLRRKGLKKSTESQAFPQAP